MNIEDFFIGFGVLDDGVVVVVVVGDVVVVDIIGDVFDEIGFIICISLCLKLW